MKHVAIAIGWMAAGFFAVAVAGDTGRRVAQVEADFPATVRAAKW
ncbi:hypothetical protein [Oceanicola sp. 22II-s10i]|nr:hypothetical protein [Oceanicola sp. 22II-s10i]